MGKRRRLDHIGIELPSAGSVFLDQPLSEPAGDMGNLDRVSQTTMQSLAALSRNDLGDATQTLERRAIENAVTVTLALGAQAPVRWCFS